MKPRVSARLPHRLHAQLTGAAGRSAATQSAIIAAALESFLAERPDAGRAGALDRMSRQLDRLEQGGRLVEETLALLAQVYLTLTPKLADDARAEARTRGAERWSDFETRLANRIAAGRQTLERVLEPLADAGVGCVAAEPSDGVAPETAVGGAEGAS
jgi:hypothetical protein